MIVMMMQRQRFTFYAPIRVDVGTRQGLGLGLGYRLVECTKFVPGVGEERRTLKSEKTLRTLVCFPFLLLRKT